MPDDARPALGRPRGFDVDVALERAMLAFWELGYDGASLAELTEAMGISRTSMYAAFGTKEQLFAQVLERYSAGPASYGTRAIAEPTARAVATAYLAGTVEATTRPGHPAGCLGVQGALATGEAGRPARDALALWRDRARLALEHRFRRAVEAGDLPADSDPGHLARYLMAVSLGMAVQASDGADADELRGAAETALQNWPPVAVDGRGAQHYR